MHLGINKEVNNKVSKEGFGQAAGDFCTPWFPEKIEMNKYINK
jgi:hypothetical protein